MVTSEDRLRAELEEDLERAMDEFLIAEIEKDTRAQKNAQKSIKNIKARLNELDSSFA